MGPTSSREDQYEEPIGEDEGLQINPRPISTAVSFVHLFLFLLIICCKWAGINISCRYRYICLIDELSCEAICLENFFIER